MSAELNQEVERIAEAAQDALTDDMIARLSGTASNTIDLLDRVGRSGLDKAIPALAEMVNNGDLERLVQLARAVGGAQDAITDDMVSRVVETASDGMALLDRVNRSGLDRALPTLTKIVENGDLERVAELARLIGSAQDALTDDMVSRLADTVSNGISLVDRLHRGGVDRFVALLERMESTGQLERVVEGLTTLPDQLELLEQLLGCVDKASDEFAKGSPATGGFGPLLGMVRSAENQETLRFVFTLGKQVRTTCAQRKK